MTTWSASRSASSSSWVVSTTQQPSVGEPADQRSDPLAAGHVDRGGRLVEEHDLGAPARASASDSRCCSPPESWRHVERPARRARPARAARRRRPGCRSRRRTARPPRPPRMPGYTPPCCSITPSEPTSWAWSAIGVEPEHPHRSAVGPAVALARLDGGGLAGAVRAEQGGDRARLGGERQAVDRHQIAVADHRLDDLDGVVERRRHTSSVKAESRSEPRSPTPGVRWTAHTSLTDEVGRSLDVAIVGGFVRWLHVGTPQLCARSFGGQCVRRGDQLDRDRSRIGDRRRALRGQRRLRAATRSSGTTGR